MSIRAPRAACSSSQPDPSGSAMIKTRSETVVEADTMRLTSYAVTDAGEQKMMEIVYTRK